MSAEHCGHMQETPYCAYCGAEIDKTMIYIQGLKRHVDDLACRAQKRVEEIPEDCPEDHQSVRRRKKLLDKWQGRQAALKELMDDTPK